jgi:hypothetical protein
MKAIYVATQDEKTRKWTPVGWLTKEDGVYRFGYTKGALRAQGFEPFGRMNDLQAQYLSSALPPLFANRTLPKNRPEYAEYMDWLGLTPGNDSDIQELGRTGGRRATDNIELIPCPEKNEAGECEVYFFSRGIRHAADATSLRVNSLAPPDRLYLCKDIQNTYDGAALMLRTSDPVAFVGYLPAYFTPAFSDLLTRHGPESVHVTVEKVNTKAPAHYRLLCKLTSVWPKGFAPFAGEEFEPIVRGLFHPLVDPMRVNLNEEWEVLYWARAFGVSPTALREAVAAVGTAEKDVRQFLKQERGGRER